MEDNISVHLISVIKDLKAREKRGLDKYQTTMDRTDLSHKEWMQHAYEEALDMALYLKKAIIVYGATTVNEQHDSSGDF